MNNTEKKLQEIFTHSDVRNFAKECSVLIDNTAIEFAEWLFHEPQYTQYSKGRKEVSELYNNFLDNANTDS